MPFSAERQLYCWLAVERTLYAAGVAGDVVVYRYSGAYAAIYDIRTAGAPARQHFQPDGMVPDDHIVDVCVPLPLHADDLGLHPPEESPQTPIVAAAWFLSQSFGIVYRSFGWFAGKRRPATVYHDGYGREHGMACAGCLGKHPRITRRH